MSNTPNTCPICDDAPGHHWLWRDDRLRVIDARDADHPAFLRVIWNGHVREMTDLADADRDHLMQVVWQVERCVREIAQPEKINLGSLGNIVASEPVLQNLKSSLIGIDFFMISPSLMLILFAVPYSVPRGICISSFLTTTFGE